MQVPFNIEWNTGLDIPSCPQACIQPSFCDLYSTSAVSVMLSASISARSATQGPSPAPPIMRPTTPVFPTPSLTSSTPYSFNISTTFFAVSYSLKEGSGCAWNHLKHAYAGCACVAVVSVTFSPACVFVWRGHAHSFRHCRDQWNGTNSYWNYKSDYIFRVTSELPSVCNHLLLQRKHFRTALDWCCRRAFRRDLCIHSSDLGFLCSRFWHDEWMKWRFIELIII